MEQNIELGNKIKSQVEKVPREVVQNYNVHSKSKTCTHGHHQQGKKPEQFAECIED